jgi:hypothetical protein
MTYKYRSLNVLFFMSSQTIWHSIVHLNISVFISNLVIHTIIKEFFSMKHIYNCAIPLKTWISWGVLGIGIFTKASIFIKLGIFRFLEIINSKIVLEHLFFDYYETWSQPLSIPFVFKWIGPIPLYWHYNDILSNWVELASE